MKIDVAIPTYGSNSIIPCLEALETAIENSPFEIHRIRVDCKPVDNDTTLDELEEFCIGEYEYAYYESNRNLPKSREFLINQNGTKWMLFIDDDVLVSKDYLMKLYDCIAPNIAAIQGRKQRWEDPNEKWIKRRVMRGTFFATLLRTDIAKGITIPKDCTVLEEEYLRQKIQDKGYIWTFHHNAYLSHNSQKRHKIDFNEGYVAAKYGLLECDYVLLHPFYSILSRQGIRNIYQHTDRAIGYIYGWLTS